LENVYPGRGRGGKEGDSSRWGRGDRKLLGPHHGSFEGEEFLVSNLTAGKGGGMVRHSTPTARQKRRKPNVGSLQLGRGKES